MASIGEHPVEQAMKACVDRLGHHELKVEQKEAILKFILEGLDVFVCLPTGFGKSVIYYSIPIICDIIAERRSPPWSMVVIISPLISLMKDQVASLERKGLSAVAIVVDDMDDNSGVLRGDFQYIFTTPEILLCSKHWNGVFQSSTFQERLVGIIVDEAHCVKKWGQQFRKEYSKLGELRGFFPSHVHVMALTATASSTTRSEIIKILGMKKPHIIAKCPNRSNIFFSVEKKTDELDDVMTPLVEEVKEKRTKMDKMIIFCRSYTDCASIFYFFKDALREHLTDPPGFPNVAKFRLVDMFTACNSSSIKNQILASFTSPNGRLRVVIATIAFGMGVDCPNIRRIIHWSPPSDIESYIQEVGRAGRDGETSYATLFYSKRDISLPFMDDLMVAYCRNSQTCRRDLLFRDFDFVRDTNVTGCKCCDLCGIVCECIDCEF